MADHGMWFLPCCFTSFWIYFVSFIFVACTVSSRFRFYIKFFLLAPYYCMMTAVFVVISIPTPASKNNFHKISKFAKWTEPIWGIKYNVKGTENYKEDSNYIIVANHQSSFDMNVVANFMPRNTTFLAKKAVLYNPIVAVFFWLGGMLFIDRDNHDRAMNTMKKAANEIKNEKYNLWIFPEGTRNMGGKLLPFKKGAFHLAQQNQIPVLPIVISNYENIVNFHERRFTTGTINITILPEVSTKGLEPSDVGHLTEKVYSIMCKEFERSLPSQQQ